MKRISTCLRFQTKNMIISIIYFTVIYFLVSIGLLCIPLLSGGDITTNSFSSGFIIGAVFFAFVYVIADYRQSFNYLMINGNTRKTIFVSSSLSNIVLSFILTFLTFIFDITDSLINRMLAGDSNTTVNLLQIIYPGCSKASVLLFCTAMLIALTAFSMLYGALAYKFGKYFIILFWVGFGLVFLALPFSAKSLDIIKLIETVLFIGKPNGILLAPISFITAAVLFGTVTYLIAKRQPQTAPVQ